MFGLTQFYLGLKKVHLDLTNAYLSLNQVSLGLMMNFDQCLHRLYMYQGMIRIYLHHSSSLHLSHEMTKPPKGVCRKDSDQPGQQPSLIEVFAVCSVGS